MTDWTKENIGDILVYKDKSEIEGKLKNKKLAIYDVDIKVPNTIGFVEYPIALNSTIYPPLLNSRIGHIGLIKDNQKESEEYLEGAGDWCFIEKVSKDEMGELERIAKTPKTPSYEDLSPEDIFKF